MPGEAVYRVSGPILRPRPPAIAVPGRTTRPTLVIGMTIVCTLVVTTGVPVLIATPVRGLGVLYRIGARLDWQVIGRLGRTCLGFVFALWTGLPPAALNLVLLMRGTVFRALRVAIRAALRMLLTRLCISTRPLLAVLLSTLGMTRTVLLRVTVTSLIR